jgi:transcriptional regulator with XRE-family HTH domain
MLPEELRAFRESLGLSRREFAPRLFISEPTLERWERGQGGPREPHVHILRRMRDQLARKSQYSFFRYDASEEPAAPSEDLRQGIVEGVRAAGGVLRGRRTSKKGLKWSLRFSLADPSEGSSEVRVTCEGSFDPRRPSIDFTLFVPCDEAPTKEVLRRITSVCFAHGAACGWPRRAGRRCVLPLGNRLFNTGCSPEAVRCVLDNLRACWRAVKRQLRTGRSSGCPSRGS